MAVNLLAVCKNTRGLLVKRVKTTSDVQSQLEGVFIQQEQTLRNGVTEEIEFDGGWRPEPNELLYVPATSESKAVLQDAKRDVISLPVINASQFDQENIKALAVLMRSHGKERLLIQEFSPRQSIERKFSLVLDGDTFGRLTKPAFSIGATLTGILEEDKIKFRLFSRMKIVFDLTDIYQEATDAEVDDFCKLSRIGVADHQAFKDVADQKMRKLIHAIMDRDTLTKYTANQIVEAAATQGFNISTKKHQIIMPAEKAEAKALLHFLDDGLYRAALTGDIFITNSKRKHKSA